MASASRAALGPALITDVRHAVRNIWTHRGFSAVVAVTLSLGLGAATAVFSVIDSVLLRQLPFPRAAALVWVGETTPASHDPVGPSMPLFEAWRARAVTLSGLAVYSVQPEALTGVTVPARINVGLVSPSFFSTLGVRPRLGRALTDQDDRWGATPVVLLGDSLWHDAFHGDPTVIGRPILLDGAPAIVIGVMPPEFAFPRVRAAAWRPGVPMLGFEAADPRAHMWGAFGRLRPGTSLREVTRELTDLRRHAPAEFSPGSAGAAGTKVRVLPLRGFAAGDVATILWLVLGASGLLLLIACANTANLLLARVPRRRRAIAVSRALGASQWSVVRRFFIESAVLACTGGALGVAMALGLTRVVARLGARELPRAQEISVHTSALLVAVLLVFVTTVLAGLVPAILAVRTSPAESLKASASGISEGRGSRRWREAIEVAELALALMLLSGASVLAKSVALRVPGSRGVSRDRVLVSSLMRPLGAWPGDQGPMREFGQQLVTQLKIRPGVRDAAISLALPGDPLARSMFHAARPASAAPDSADVAAEVVRAGYVRTLGIPLLRG